MLNNPVSEQDKEVIEMKRFVAVGIGAFALSAAVAAYICCCHCQRELVKIQPESSSRTAVSGGVLTDGELTRENQGVGWVFGRMIGAADAPGNPNFSPFGGTSQRLRANP